MDVIERLPPEIIKRATGISRTAWPDHAGPEHALYMPTVTMMDLRTVRLPYHSPAVIPLASFPRLQHLEISFMQSFSDLDKFLEGIPELKSFSLVRMITGARELPDLTLKSTFVDALFSALSRARAPLLTTFALQHSTDYRYTLSSAQCAQLSIFLRRCTRLRRLFCDFPMKPKALPQYFATLAELKALEVLGLNMRVRRIDIELIKSLQNSLPLGMYALSLSTSARDDQPSPFSYLVSTRSSPTCMLLNYLVFLTACLFS